MRSIKLLWQHRQNVRFFGAASGKVTNHNVEKSPITVQLWNERLKHNAFNANENPMHAPTNLLQKSAADCRYESILISSSINTSYQHPLTLSNSHYHPL